MRPNERGKTGCGAREIVKRRERNRNKTVRAEQSDFLWLDVCAIWIPNYREADVLLHALMDVFTAHRFQRGDHKQILSLNLLPVWVRLDEDQNRRRSWPARNMFYRVYLTFHIRLLFAS